MGEVARKRGSDWTSIFLSFCEVQATCAVKEEKRFTGMFVWGIFLLMANFVCNVRVPLGGFLE